MSERTVGITGASGYVGGELAATFMKAGWHVVALTRRPVVGMAGLEHRRYDLGEPISVAILDDLDVLIHAAYDLRAVNPVEIWEKNVEGTQRLFAAAAAAGIKGIIHTSSMSAYEGTTQVYGKAKIACENYVESVGGLSIRLGLVTGESSGGMSGALRKIAGLPVVPVIGANSYQYLLAQADLSRIFLTVATEYWKRGVVSAAAEQPVSFGNFMRSLAPSSHRVFVPLPWRPVYWAMRLAEALKLRLPFRSDSLLGLVKPAPTLVAPVVITPTAIRDSR